MAYPFLTDKPYCSDPQLDSITLSMVTDPAHATTAALYLTLYSDAARSTSVGTDSAAASGGSVQEVLTVSVGSLSSDTIYYPTLEYEEVSGSGTKVKVPDVEADCSYYTLGDEWNIYSDPHINEQDGDAISVGGGKYTNYSNMMTAMAANGKANLTFSGGDEHIYYFVDQADAYLWGETWRNFAFPMLDVSAHVQAWGNHERRDGTDGDDDTWAKNMMVQFQPGPTGTSALANYGKIVSPNATLLWAEPYSESGFPETGVNQDTYLSATQLSFIRDEIAANEKPWLVVHTHSPLQASTYARAGGTNIIETGKQSATVHADLVSHLTSNANCIGIVYLRGHDHRWEHSVFDGVHYLGVGSAAAPFNYTAASLVTDGYFADTSWTAPVGVKFIEGQESGGVVMSFAGYVHASLGSDWGLWTIYRTSDADNNAMNEVVYTFSPANSRILSNGVHWAGLVSNGSHWGGLGW